jgi:hypothetical protein
MFAGRITTRSAAQAQQQGTSHDIKRLERHRPKHKEASFPKGWARGRCTSNAPLQSSKFAVTAAHVEWLHQAGHAVVPVELSGGGHKQPLVCAAPPQP